MDSFGLTTVTFRKKSLSEIMKIAKENDLKYIELGGDVHCKPMDLDGINNAIALKEKYRIEFISYGSYFRLLENTVDDFKDVLETADLIGAKIIRIWMGNKSSNKTSYDEFNKMVEETKQIAKMAKSKNITIGFEFHHNTFNDSAESSLRFLNSVNMDNVKTYWQPFTDKTDYSNLEQILPYVICVHIFSWSKKGVRFSLKRLKHRWKKYLKIIKDSNKNPYYIMEFVKNDSEKQFSKDVKFLKSL